MRCRHWLTKVIVGVCIAFGAWGTAAFAQEASSELIQMVIDLLQDQEMRSVGLEQVRYEAKGAAATTQFASQLTKLTPPAQIELLRALGTRGDAAAKPQVMSLLKSDADASVRMAAIVTLGDIGDSTDLPPLMTFLKDESNDIQSAAKKSLARLRHANVNPLLVEAMKSGNAAGQASIIEVLVARRATESMPQVAKLSADENPIVRRAAMNALSELGSADQIQDMVLGVLKAETGAERDAAEKALVNLCNRNGNPDSRAEPVLAARAKLDDASQLELLTVVAKVGGAKALEAVEATMASENALHHEAGLAAFCNWPEPSITDRLLKLIESTANQAERNLEFKALVRLASIRDKRKDNDRLARFQQAMKLAKSNEERSLVIDKSRSAYSVETLRFVLPYLDEPAFREVACKTIVELAHHREVREPNKAEFDKALDRVMQISKDAVVKDRAQRYKNGETWQRPKG